jgi:multiple sugar transport system substrate-binding protein
MKKLTSILMVLILVLSFTMLSVSAEEEVTLTFSGWGDGNEKTTIEAILEKFTQDTGVKVEYLYVPEDYMTKLTTMAAAGQLPDCGYLTEANTVEWANQGMLEDMTPMLESEGFAQKLDSNKFIDKDGRVVGISMACETIVMYYNPAYFDQMGVAYPPSKGEDAWTWDEFVDVCRQLTVDGNGKHPGEDGFDPSNIVTYGVKIGKGNASYEALMRSNGGGIFTEDYSDIALDSPESIEVLQALADLINVEHVSPSPEDAASSMDNASSFLSNSVAMIVDGQWAIQSLAIAAEEDGITFDVGVLPYFKTPVTGNTGGPAVVFKGTKHVDEAMKLVSYLTTTDYVMTFINSGLWQPVTEEWYTNEELIDRWIVDGVHPAHYRDAVIDYTMNYLKPTSYFRVGCFSQIENLFLPALDTAVLGTSTAQQSIDSVINECRKVYSEYLASLS